MSHAAATQPVLLAHGLLQDPGAVPLVIAVAGHRDPRPEYVPLLRENFQRQLEQLLDSLPHTPLLMLNGLAEGMDSEAAEVFLEVMTADRIRRGALAPHHQLVAALPKTPEDYRGDFMDPAALGRLEQLLSRCDGVLHPGNCIELAVRTKDPDAELDTDDSACYGQQGVFLVRHCYLLFGFFDGVETKLVGGTSQTVAMQKGEIHPRFVSVDEVLANKEPGALVLHHTPRLKKGSPLQTPGALRFWPPMASTKASYPSDGIQLPPNLLSIPNRLEIINQAILNPGIDPFPYERDGGCCTRIWCWSDSTATKAKQLYEKGCGLLVLTGLMLVLLTQLSPTYKALLWAALLAAYKLFPLLQKGPKLQFISKRCLAECLTVQHLWIALKIDIDATDLFHTRSNTKELGWIRNILRAIRIQHLTFHALQPRNHANALVKSRVWMKGQADFLQKRIHEFRNFSKQWNAIAVALGGMAIAFALTEDLHNSLNHADQIVIVLLAALAAALSYSRLIGYAETADRYRRSLDMFKRGMRAIDLTLEDDYDVKEAQKQQRIVVEALGREKLDELNDWVAGQLERVYAPGA